MNERRAMRLLQTAFVLALFVVGASSYLRLASNGLGCEPWPACYGAAAAAQSAQSSLGTASARIAHRIAASAFAFVALAAVILGWRGWNAVNRGVAALMLVVTALLAVVGRFTPSPQPGITLINVLGGLALLACIALLVVVQSVGRADVQRRPALGLVALILVLGLQAALGAMISIRSAGAACAQGCSAQWRPGTLQLFDPSLPGSVRELRHSQRGGQVLHATHRLGAIVVTVLAAVLAAVIGPAAAIRGRLLVAATVLCLALGLALAISDGSLELAVAHAVGAAALVAAASALLGRGLADRRAA